ncbi:MAG: tRNA lysidine(34) synthetase TilS [Gammaproteobacteria bacterium]
MMISGTLKKLPIFPHIRRFVVAYSGGLDSHVLLNSISGCKEMGDIEIVAIHVNHGLSDHADTWSEHCATQCKKLGIAYVGVTVDATPDAGESPEAAAREVRYSAFEDVINEGDCLLTAHHQDDQAETLLIQLLRGAGPRGLAAMPVFSDFGKGWHARPLLAVARIELETYAKENNLSWVDDESNFDTGYDRNFLRHEILPLLKERFPAVSATLSRSSSLCSEAALILTDSARNDYQSMLVGSNTFSANALFDLGEIRARNVLHQWFRDNEYPTPTAAQMQRIWEDVVCTSDGSCPLVTWSEIEVRRYRDVIYVSTALKPHDAKQVLQWDMDEPLDITGLGQLSCLSHRANDNTKLLSEKRLAGKMIEMRFRQGGEEIKPIGRNGHHSLKKLFQEQGITPWERDRLPLLFVEDDLIAVADLWIADSYKANTGELGYEINWSPSGNFGALS